MRLDEWFVVRDRVTEDSETPYTTLRDDAPEWLREWVYAAHDGELPNDWRYGVCADIVRGFAEADDASDTDVLCAELAESLVDVGNYYDLITWMGDNLARVGDVDSANEEYGWSHDDGVTGIIRLGQWSVIRAMCDSFAEALAENADAS